jgi:hypothetical protein
MITKDTLWADDPVPPRTVPIDDHARVALGQLRQAYTCAQNAGVDLWDFALEIGRLFDTGLTISALRWLVAKRFVEHGQESSTYGAPHRTFCRGAGFFFGSTTCVVLTSGGAAFVDDFLKQPVRPLHSILSSATGPIAGGETAALENGAPVDMGLIGTSQVAVRPCWSSTRRELTVNGTVVKRFRVRAPNQELILSAFEEEGWPDHIDDPLPVRSDIDPHTRLHDAINRLNGRQLHRLIHFSGNGHGDGVSWAFRQTARLRPNRPPGKGERVKTRHLPEPSTPDRHLRPLRHRRQ